MDTKPLTVDAPTYPQLAKLMEERVLVAATKREVGIDVFQSALGYPGTKLEDGIVALVLKLANAVLFGEQIKAGGFDYLWGFAEKPEEIVGQVAHVATGETKLDHPGKTLTTKQVWERYGDGDLSELLDYAVKHLNDQRDFPIGIVWKVGNLFWCAILVSSGSDRKLNVDRDDPVNPWLDDVRFLVRK